MKMDARQSCYYFSPSLYGCNYRHKWYFIYTINFEVGHFFHETTAVISAASFQASMGHGFLFDNFESQPLSRNIHNHQTLRFYNRPPWFLLNISPSATDISKICRYGNLEKPQFRSSHRKGSQPCSYSCQIIVFQNLQISAGSRHC